MLFVIDGVADDAVTVPPPLVSDAMLLGVRLGVAQARFVHVLLPFVEIQSQRVFGNPKRVQF